MTCSNPADAAFSYSFAGRTFFVVGLHPCASRLSWRFAYSTLAASSTAFVRMGGMIGSSM